MTKGDFQNKLSDKKLRKELFAFICMQSKFFQLRGYKQPISAERSSNNNQ